jgi:hypothetical protein
MLVVAVTSFDCGDFWTTQRDRMLHRPVRHLSTHRDGLAVGTCPWAVPDPKKKHHHDVGYGRRWGIMTGEGGCSRMPSMWATDIAPHAAYGQNEAVILMDVSRLAR